MWEELHKVPVNISAMLPPILKEGHSDKKFLRLEMDNTGMDPCKGKVVNIEDLRRQLPK